MNATSIPAAGPAAAFTPRRRAATRFLLFLTALLIAPLFSGCSRYAPVPVVPRNKILTISLRTQKPITNEFYYYIAFDTSGASDSQGPYPYLSGNEIGRNWNYYIRLHNGIFSEKRIVTEQDLYDTPSNLDTTSQVYYYTYVYGSNIVIKVYLDRIKTGLYDLRLNFITSREPLMDTQDPVIAIDYLYRPTLAVRTQPGTSAFSYQYPNILRTILAEEDQPADIVDWAVYVDEI